MYKLILLTLVFFSTQGFGESNNPGDLYYPPGAPKISSDYLSTMSVDGFRKRFSKEGKLKFHRGIDIPGNNGWLILAAADGMVLETELDKCAGLGIYIGHGKGFDGTQIIALYSHLGELLVSKGEKVKRGQPIASLGNTHLNRVYNCNGVIRHLHFELYPSLISFNRHLKPALNPHLYWADGPNKITCFEKNKTFKQGYLTYPLSCQQNEKLIRDNYYKGEDAFNRGDYETALSEWRVFAELGDKWAQNDLGFMYQNGYGVKQNYETALKWFQLSAEQGEPTAQQNLARLFYGGIMEDYIYSYMWAHLSDEASLIESLSVLMSSEDISKAKNLAIECLEKNYKGC